MEIPSYKGRVKGKKRNFKKLNRGNSNIIQRVDDTWPRLSMGRGLNKLTAVDIGLAIPDEFTETFIYALNTANYFTTATSTDSIALLMNGMRQIKSGTNSIIPDWTDSAGNFNKGMHLLYKRYRVIRSTVEIHIVNRETVNPVVYFLFPSQTLPAVNSSAEAQWILSQRYCKQLLLGNSTSGKAAGTLKMSFSPEKLIGEQYHEQDEYSGDNITAGDPTTPVYWGFGSNNANINTVTTGGCVATIKVVQKVLCYEPDRDETAMKRPVMTPEQQLTIARENYETLLKNSLSEISV